MGLGGFFKGLGKAALAGGAAVAAPFSGGASLASLPMILGAGGAALGAISQGKAQNRGTQFTGQMDLERLLMERDQQQFGNQLALQQENRLGTSDAFRKLLSAQRVTNPGARPSLSPYSVAPRQATGAEVQGADALTREVLARLQNGNPLQAPAPRPSAVNPNLLKAGGLESVLGYASPALSFLGRMAPRQTGTGYPDMAGSGSFGGVWR